MADTTSRIKWAVPTQSLGQHPTHSLEQKLSAAKRHGFDGIELVYTDLTKHAKDNSQSLQDAAREARRLAELHSLEILSLNPLKYFEGNLAVPFEDRLSQARDWIDLARIAGTSIIQMPSQFLVDSTGDEAIIVPELQALADMAAPQDISIAYEAVAFAQHNALWQDSLQIVEAVNRPNFGLCLDSFHIHARIWGDPMAEDGLIPGGDEATRTSLAELVARCPKEKVLYFQLSDAVRQDPPLTFESPLFKGLEVKDPRLALSRSCRPFPGEGYFPVGDMARILVKEFGWQGWISMESFPKENKLEENGPEVMARRAKRSVDTICAAVH